MVSCFTLGHFTTGTRTQLSFVITSKQKLFLATKNNFRDMEIKGNKILLQKYYVIECNIKMKTIFNKAKLLIY